MKKVLRIVLMSTAICFSLTFALILINALMGVFIGLNYYFMIALALTVALSFGLVLFDLQKIFSRKKNISSRVKVKTDDKVKSTRTHTVNSRRKIS